MTLIALCGGMGKGKTLILTKLLHAYHEIGRNVYTNIKTLKMPMYYIDSYEALNNVHDGVVGISEFWVWADSRNTPKNNMFLSEIVLQSRKGNIDIIYDLQDFGQIDKRIRSVTDMIIHAKDKSPLVTENGNTYQVFTLDIFERYFTGDYKHLGSVSLELSDYFNLYDTLEKYKVPSKEGKIKYHNNKLPKSFNEAQSKKNGKGKPKQEVEELDLGLNDFSFEDSIGLEEFAI